MQRFKLVEHCYSVQRFILLGQVPPPCSLMCVFQHHDTLLSG